MLCCCAMGGCRAMLSGAGGDTGGLQQGRKVRAGGGDNIRMSTDEEEDTSWYISEWLDSALNVPKILAA